MAPVIALVLAFLGLFYQSGMLQVGPEGRLFGADFAVFWSAAHLVTVGDDPYDQALLYRTEHIRLLHEGISTIEDRPLVRAGNQPLFYWLLGPLSTLHFRLAALRWSLSIYVLSILAFVVALRALGWRRIVLPTVLFMATPQTVLLSLYGAM
jgi:hypothetical protein